MIFGGLALGFAASRFIKASSQQRYATSSQASQGYASSPTPARPVLPTSVPGAAGNVPAAGTYGNPVEPGLDAPFPDPVVEPDRTDPLAPRPPSAYPAGGI